MGKDIDPRAEAANPYASPQSLQGEEKSRRRRTKWRIIPTVLVASIAFLALLYHALLLTQVTVTAYVQFTSEEDLFHFEDSPLLVIAPGLCLFGIIGDLTGVFSALNCWKGRWKRFLFQLGGFLGMNLLLPLVVFLMV